MILESLQEDETKSSMQGIQIFHSLMSVMNYDWFYFSGDKYYELEIIKEESQIRNIYVFYIL